MTQLELLNKVQEAKKEIKLNLDQELYLSYHIEHNFNEDVREFFFQIAVRLENEYLGGAITKAKYSRWRHVFLNLEGYVLYK